MHLQQKLMLYTRLYFICDIKLMLYVVVCYSRILELEEDYIRQVCADVIAVKPDLVITEKGVSDLAQHFLMKAGELINCTVYR